MLFWSLALELAARWRRARAKAPCVSKHEHSQLKAILKSITTLLANWPKDRPATFYEYHRDEGAVAARLRRQATDGARARAGMSAPARLGLGCALALAAAARSPTCSYKSLHADQLAFHAQRAVRVDCSAAAPAGAAQSAAVQWTLPDDCSVADPAVQLNSSLVHEIVCAAPGPKTFRVVHLSDDGTASEAMARLSMSRSNLCYDWYITQVLDAGGGEPSAADELAQRGSRVRPAALGGACLCCA